MNYLFLSLLLITTGLLLALSVIDNSPLITVGHIAGSYITLTFIYWVTHTDLGRWFDSFNAEKCQQAADNAAAQTLRTQVFRSLYSLFVRMRKSPTDNFIEWMAPRLVTPLTEVARTFTIRNEEDFYVNQLWNTPKSATIGAPEDYFILRFRNRKINGSLEVLFVFARISDGKLFYRTEFADKGAVGSIDYMSVGQELHLELLKDHFDKFK
jgi:hypothetical protein